jgi:hypothetical protein
LILDNDDRPIKQICTVVGNPRPIFNRQIVREKKASGVGDRKVSQFPFINNPYLTIFRCVKDLIKQNKTAELEKLVEVMVELTATQNGNVRKGKAI